MVGLVNNLRRREIIILGGYGRVVWALALGLFVFGDVVTTWVGLELGLVEGNPVTRRMLGAVGFWPAMVAGKSVIVAVVAVEWWVVDRALGWRLGALAPVMVLVLMGAGIVAWNTRLILMYL